MEYRILVVSDLQCGSIFGLLPEGFMSSDDKEVGLNPGQAYLWRCWKDLCTRVRNLAPDVIVVNGDIIDGPQPAQRGTELCLPILTDQRDAAEQALSLLVNSCPVRPMLFFVQGTEYHDAKAGTEVEAIAKSLGAQSYYGLGTGKWSREVLDLDIDGVVLNFAHGISVPVGFYRATAVDREAVWSAIAGKEGKMPKADGFVRSHTHFFVHVEHASKHGVVTPCWELQTRYMRKNSIYRMLPDLGVAYLDIDSEAKRQGEDPIVVRKILYRLPEYRPTSVKLGGSNGGQETKSA